MDINKLLKTKHIEVCGNKYFGWSCVVKNGIRQLYTITLCGKRFEFPHKLRSWRWENGNCRSHR